MYEKIEELMKLNGVSAYRLSKDIDINQSNITRWKNGESKPSWESLVKISQYFNVPLDYFL